MTAALLAIALLATPAEGGAPTGVEPRPSGRSLGVGAWQFAGFPVVTYGSDIGLELGAALFLYRPVTSQALERDEAALNLTYATRGPREVDLDGGLRRLFGTSLRLRAKVDLADDPHMPYWGEGAGLGGLSVPAGYGTPPPPYRYHDRRLFAAVVLRGAIAGPFGWHARARWLGVDVRAPSALLAASAPPGAGGGHVALFEAGLLLDTRDRELATRGGVFATLAGFAAPHLGSASEFVFHGYDAALRVYLPLWPGATLAGRALYDLKLAGVPGGASARAAVPFFERSLYEGEQFGEGLGGTATVRGIARFRLAGDEKALANVQLRAHVFVSHLLGKLQEWGLELGVDAGRARQPGYSSVHGQGLSAGIRMIWDRSVLGRIDAARAPGGENTVYVSFGELF
jgi:hypothetical protein